MDTKRTTPSCPTCQDTGAVLQCDLPDALLPCRICCSEDDCGQVDCPDCTVTSEAEEVLVNHLAEMIERVRRVA
jgi:hypothetical protein